MARCSAKNPIVAAMLLDAGAPINALNRAGLSPLAVACRGANWPLARFLLERGAKQRLPDAEPALVAAASIADDDPEGIRCCSSTAPRSTPSTAASAAP